MEFKKKLSEYWKKILEIWAAFMAACGVFWEKTKTVARQVGDWLSQAGWKAAQWWNWLAEKCKMLAGRLAVVALKLRRWIRKKTARLRNWWHHWSGRKWLQERTRQVSAWTEGIRARLPQREEPQEPEVREVREVHEVRPAPAPVKQKVPARPRVNPNTPLGKVLTTLAAIGNGIKGVCIRIFRLRRFILAAPVVFLALRLALLNATRLPKSVGLQIQANGEFARMVSRPAAVLGPLALTAFCLMLLFCSKKTLLPWLISLFTLILPLLIWMTNYYV